MVRRAFLLFRGLFVRFNGLDFLNIKCVCFSSRLCTYKHLLADVDAKRMVLSQEWVSLPTLQRPKICSNFWFLEHSGFEQAVSFLLRILCYLKERVNVCWVRKESSKILNFFEMLKSKILWQC